MQHFHSQKKTILKQIISFMQDNIVFNYTTDWNLEKEYLLTLRYTMAIE